MQQDVMAVAVNFEQEIDTFLDGNGIDFRKLSNACRFVVRTGMLIVPVALGQACNMDQSRREKIVGECVSELSLWKINDVYFLYEDAFRRGGEQWRQRVLARCGLFESVFARKCRVVRLQSQREKEMVRCFLERNHSLGWCGCKYCYALVLPEKGMLNSESGSCDSNKYDGGAVVAVASFSSALSVKRYCGRDLFAIAETGSGYLDYALGESASDAEQSGSAHAMNAGDALPFESYQWLRYASLPGIRVVGGMGRLLNAFVNDLRHGIAGNNNGTFAGGKTAENEIPVGRNSESAVQHVEIMSYSDTEWSCGNVYRELGFKEYGGREELEFFVDAASWQRLRKLPSFGEDAGSGEGREYIRVKNCGSKRFLLQIL